MVFAVVTTILVAGPPRCGTSMIAGCLHHLGVYMGRLTTDGRFEDRDAWESSIDVDARNAAHPVWGTKWPWSYQRVGLQDAPLRDPRVIYAWRNPSHRQRYSRVAAGDFAQWLATTAAWASWLEHHHDWPVLCVDFDEAINRPIEAVEQLVDFCGLTPTTDQITVARLSVDHSRGYADAE